MSVSSIVKVVIVASVFVGVPAFADNTALFINNSNYSRLDNPRRTVRENRIIQTLRSGDFSVISGQRKWSKEMLTMAQLFTERLSDADRRIVILGGHFVHTPRDSWLLDTETGEVDGLTVGMSSLSVGAIMDRVAGLPGRADVMLAPSENPPEATSGPKPGVGPLEIPQGVTVITGPLDQLWRLMDRSLLVPGTSLADTAAFAESDLWISGFITDAMPYLPE